MSTSPLIVQFEQEEDIGRCVDLESAPFISVSGMRRIANAASSTVSFTDKTRNLRHWAATKDHGTGIKRVHPNYRNSQTYIAPCPPNGETHVYELRIDVYDRDGMRIATAAREYRR
jgi:phosphatidylethanolamine-binding protein (PEBP) family uncharacterized protein